MLSSQHLKREAKPVGKLRDKTSVRREKFFERQTRLRQEFFDEVRVRAVELLYAESEKSGAKKQQGLKKGQPKHHATSASKYLASLLVQPDFLVDVPADLGADWFAFQRPEGQRVILVAEGGRCCAFTKAGYLIESFATALPPTGCTILDAVIVTPPRPSEQSYAIEEQRPTPWIAILDCLTWNDCSIGDSTAECRRFMLQSRFDELSDSLGTVSPLNEMVDATADNLDELYHSTSKDFLPDGIIFVHKEALYLPGLSQLYLLWRDPHISRYCIDTTDPAGDEIPQRQLVNLKLRLRDGAVMTEDRVIVDRIAPEKIPAILESLDSTIYLRRWKQGHIKTHLLIRYLGLRRRPCNGVVRASIEGLNLGLTPVTRRSSDENDVEAAGLLLGMNVVGTPSPKRNTAESLNRMIHQYIMREQRKLSHQIPSDAASQSAFLTFDDITKSALTGQPNFRMMLLGGREHLELLVDDEESPGEEFYEGDSFPEYC